MPPYDEEEDCLPRIEIEKPDPNDTIASSLMASIIASLATVNFGYALGYSSPTEINMVKKYNVLTEEEFSWFSSIIALGAIVGSVIGGFLVQKIGRKMTIMLTATLYAPGWCLISYSHNRLGMLYAGRLISGCGVGMAALAVPMYISEIASSRYRGGLCSINQLAITLGDVIVYSVGVAVTWEWLAILPVMTSLLSIMLMAFMPETPVWLLSKKRRSRALMNMVWLRGDVYNSEAELRLIEDNLANQERLSLKSFAQPQLYRPLTIGCMMMLFQQFVGINAILFFCDDIFHAAGIKWNASILVACTLFAFTVVACFIVDMFGRRKLLLIGSVVMFVCMFLLGVYYDLAEVEGDSLSIFGHVSHTIAVGKISWLAILCVMLYIAVFAIGWGPLPWVLMGELFPPKARGQASSMVTLVNLVFTFVVTKTFTSFKQTLYQQGTFWFYAGFCVLSFLYTLFFVPETKGKSLEEIERSFNPGSTQFE